MFQTYLQEKKELLTSSLHEFFKLQKPHAVNRWGNDAIERLELFMKNGKMIRGTLVFLGYELMRKQPSDEVIIVAQAAELFQAGLLIHDDIMDNDELRRGKPSMHIQYTNLMLQENARYPKNTGKSLAMCVGDAAFFLGYQLLNQVHDLDIRQKITQVFLDELINVSFAQMQDIYHGSSLRKATLDDILELYLHKTGKYSIVLPFWTGAFIAGAKKDTMRHIEKFGADVGIVFQLIDDTLNLFGDPSVTGKPAGSDIREGKQTPYIYYLQKEGVNISDLGIEDVQKKVIELGIDEKINDLISTYTNSAKESMQKIPLDTSKRQLLESFVSYLTKRVK